MPTYVYRCTKCGAQFELVQSIKDRQAPLCFLPPLCADGSQTETVITSTSFILKGSGWAKDGYK